MSMKFEAQSRKRNRVSQEEQETSVELPSGRERLLAVSSDNMTNSPKHLVNQPRVSSRSCNIQESAKSSRNTSALRGLRELDDATESSESRDFPSDDNDSVLRQSDKPKLASRAVLGTRTKRFLVAGEAPIGGLKRPYPREEYEASEQDNKATEGGSPQSTTPKKSSVQETVEQRTQSAESSLISGSGVAVSQIEQQNLDDRRIGLQSKLSGLESYLAMNLQEIEIAKGDRDAARNMPADVFGSALKYLTALEERGLHVLKRIQDVENEIKGLPGLANIIPAKRVILQTYRGEFFDKFLPASINADHRVIEREGFLEFPTTMPYTRIKRLYIRDSYKCIAEQIKDRSVPRHIVNGTPGIGKSLFLVYLLFQLVNEGKRVFFWYGRHRIYFDGDGEVFKLYRFPDDAEESFWDGLWCLFDASGRSTADLDKLDSDLSTIVISMSLRRDRINDFKKPDLAPKTFFMPVWSIEEMKTLSEQVYGSVSDWRDRFEILGGIPRFVFEKIERSPSSIVESAAGQFKLSDTLDLVATDVELTEKVKVVHSIIHIHSEKPYNTSTNQFASEYVLKLVASKLEGAIRREFDNLFNVPIGDNL